jgi:hypothetical protein
MGYYIIEKRFKLQFEEGKAVDITFEAPDEIDLTGKKLIMKFRKNVDSPAVMMELSTDNGKIVKSGQQFTMYVEPADTAGKAGTYVTQIDVYTDGTDPIVIGKGDLDLQRDVNRN